MTTIESSTSPSQTNGDAHHHASSLEELLQDERQTNQQLSLKVIALEKDNDALRDEIANLKRDKVNREAHAEQTSADTRRNLATLQVELETFKKRVAFLEQQQPRASLTTAAITL